ncbi:MAG: DUF1566 domain-containing protein [Mariprofundaceae bacterium]|nr:DUF1566 domain-containing protein [Mariprofundaceae bacterium]
MNKRQYPHQGMRRWHEAIVFSFLFLFLIISSANQAFADQENNGNEKPTISISSDFEADDDDGGGNNDDKVHFDTDESQNDRLAGYADQSTGGVVTGTDTADILPTASIANVRVVEGNTGITNMQFTVTLSRLADGYADVNYAISDGTSRAATDYTAKRGILTIPPGSTMATITVAVNGDTVYESDETLIVMLSAPSANLTLGTASATGTIINDDVRHMNDTGMTTWGNSFSNTLAVAQATSPGQDADYGRDSNPVQNSNVDGRAGFSFTKLDSRGIPLTNQAAAYVNTPWDCVQDNVTGLMWEVKTPGGAGGLRDANHEYSWYNTNGAENGGFPGRANSGICVDTVNCDTEKYVAAINAVNLCGYSGWRMPKKGELMSIKDYGLSVSGLAIDVNYFPNTFLAWYWSATPAYRADLVWGVGYKFGDNTGLGMKSWMDHVRLVRGAK